MAMDVQQGSGSGPRCSVNLTPLIDVVLVLLIIFMIITPLLQREIAVQVPLSQQAETTPSNTDDQLLVVVSPDHIELNGDSVELPALAGVLSAKLSQRSDKTVFVQVHDDVVYQNAVAVMDVAHQAGAKTIGTVLGDAVSD